MKKQGKLYIVSIPIGNPLDITLRAINILSNVDLIICENYKKGSTFLKTIKISNVPLNELNVNNEKQETKILLKKLISGKSYALISDAGTPVFADPGLDLIKGVIKNKVNVIPIPGVSSLMTSIVISGISIKNFYYAGFLPRKRLERIIVLKKIRQIKSLLIIYETPYRINPLIIDILKIFPSHLNGVICMNLTKKNEFTLRDNLKNIKTYFEKNKFKGDFVLMIENI